MINYKKAVQCVNFFAQKAAEEGFILYKTNMLKLVYFADKKHLRECLRTITEEDRYEAWNMGPVALSVQDLIEAQAHGDTDFAESEDYLYAEEYLDIQEDSHRNMKINSKKEVNVNVLSESDLETLNFVWDTFREKLSSEGERGVFWQQTHRYPEGKKYRKGISKIDMKIHEQDMLSTVENGADPLGVFSDADAKRARELFEEDLSVRKAFNV